jgi:sialic acid synthase SpsE
MFVNSILDQSFDRFPELGTTMREVRERLELSKDEYLQLRELCRGKIDFIVTPFDIQSVEFLDNVEVDAYKIAAHNNTDIPLLREVARRGKPVIASTGMCNHLEVERLVSIFSQVDLTLLYCVSSYPVDTKDINLGMIEWLKEYGCRVGYSDHEDGISVAPAAVALGAEVIEKHITLDKSMVGFDHHMSIDPSQLIQCVRNTNLIKASLRKPRKKEILPCELHMFDNRRYSIYVAYDIPAGTKLTVDMLTIKAPLRGLTPRFVEKLVGMKTLYDLKKDDPITFGVVDL